ncbi:hypothetical protein MRX96_053108 [Rhipicephalus microplus]
MVNSKRNNPVTLDTETAKTVPTNNSGGGGKRPLKKGQKGSRDNLLVWDFLVSRLDSECYGEDLSWLDRSRGEFFIRWVHQSSKRFDRDSPNVFQVSTSPLRLSMNAYLCATEDRSLSSSAYNVTCHDVF